MHAHAVTNRLYVLVRGLIVAALIALAPNDLAEAQPVQWTIAQGGNGHYYQIIFNTSISWSGAQNAAISLGGTLATINSTCEQQFIENMLIGSSANTGSYWIGLSESAAEGVYAWVTNEPLVFIHWTPGEPNNYGGSENRGEMCWTKTPQEQYYSRRGTWNDAPDGGYSSTWGPPDVGRAGYVIEWGPNTPGPNFLVNPAFEQGTTGFQSGYIYSPSSISTDGTYAVVANPATVQPFATSYHDHTSGAGLMLAINGATQAGVVVWSETLSVQPGAQHTFSGWISSWNNGTSPAQLSVRIDGQAIGTVTAPSVGGVWQAFALSWNSGVNASALIQIVDNNLASSGNDFALDDMAFYIQSVGCIGDLTGDRIIGLPDLAALLANYGSTGDVCYNNGDLNGDARVDLTDLARLLASFGSVCQ